MDDFTIAFKNYAHNTLKEKVDPFSQMNQENFEPKFEASDV